MEKSRTSSWDWAPDVWTWTPDQGRWSPEHGRPEECVFLSLSTDAVRPHEAYDYWRETVFYGFQADRPAPGQSRAFNARVAGLIAPRGDLYWYRSDPVSGHRDRRQCRQDDYPQVDLGLVLAGERGHEQEGDRALRAGPGDLIFYDPTRPSRVRWGAHRGLHLSLDHGAVRRALGGTIPPPSEVVRSLRQSPLFPFLNAQLRLMAQNGEGLAADHQALVFEQIIDLALDALRTIGTAPDTDRPSLLHAARQLIHRELSDPDLDTTTLAGRLRCSRATLYRAFAEHDLTVAGYLREARLRRVYRLLVDAPDHWNITDIAARCGFLDSASFSRLFRRRFGMRPRDLRHRRRLS